MSSFSNILRLFPVANEKMKEEIVPDVTFPCPFCFGNGYYWRKVAYDSEKHPCPHCKGTGKLKAKVIVQWSPTGEPIPIFNTSED